MAVNPLSDRRLRNWLFRHSAARDIGFSDVSSIGAGPFDAHEFDEFLGKQNFDSLIPDWYTEVLVVGREDWTEKELRRLLRMRSGSTLRVYSQEMFVAYLISGNDPLSNVRVARRFGRGHPALQFLRSIGFEWPSTAVVGFGPVYRPNGNWRAEGFLKAIGYSVGHRGLGREQRRRKLVRAYGANVPRRFGNEYVAFWGHPRSSVRLERMAKSIARFCRLAAGRSTDFSLAIRDWETDLRWLKKKYYDGNYVFAWPRVKVW